MTFILLFVAVSCSVPYSTTRTTCDIIWMTDQGNEIARYEKSTINMTHISTIRMLIKCQETAVLMIS